MKHNRRRPAASQRFYVEPLEIRNLLSANVLAISPAAVAHRGIDHFDVVFDRPIDADTFTVADIHLSDPVGDVIATGNPTSLDAGNTTFRIPFGALSSLGTYSIRLGPDILDLLGQPMNQDGDAQAGEPADDAFRSSFEVVHTPVVVVPGILGSLLPDMTNRGGVVGKLRLRSQLSDFLQERKPFHPQELVAERVTYAYDAILEQFAERGYNQCLLEAKDDPATAPTCDADSNLFFAAYDWRLPVLVDPNDSDNLLWNDDGAWSASVEQLAWWIELAKSKWTARYGSSDEFAVDIVAHSMGGLVARAYVQAADDAGQDAEPVRNFMMLGTPNHGSVAIYQYWDPDIVLDGEGLFDRVLGLRSVLREAMSERKLDRAVELVPSLLDLMPTFPFLRRFGENSRTTPATNLLLARLNSQISELATATRVLLIGSHTLATPVTADIERGGLFNITTLEINWRKVGDGSVVFDQFADRDAGLMLHHASIRGVAIRKVEHGTLPANKRVACVVFAELQLETHPKCDRWLAAGKKKK